MLSHCLRGMLVGEPITMAEEVHDTVAILDAGAQYGKLIDRAVRELNVKTALLPLSATPEEIKAGGYKVATKCKRACARVARSHIHSHLEHVRRPACSQAWPRLDCALRTCHTAVNCPRLASCGPTLGGV